MTRKEAYEMGRERGQAVASWIDLPEIGDEIDRCLDWQGLGEVVTTENIADYAEMIAFESESEGRQYSPFEFTANEFNSLPEDGRDEDGRFQTTSEDAWEAFDQGIADGIRAELAPRVAAWIAA